MNAREQGFLLLTGYLGDPARRALTVAQFRELALRARAMEKPDGNPEMTVEDLLALGYDRTFARRVISLLSQTELLQRYLEKGRRQDCVPVTRVSGDYPQHLRKRLGSDAPGVLWAKGDLRILKAPAVSLVGSRDLLEENRGFAYEAGKQAAAQGLVLISGHARGADRTAQDSCLEHGGTVISVVADELQKHPTRSNVLYISEEGFDLAFSSQRALQRNRVIHSLGAKTFVAQCTLGRGGTWDGTRKNLRFGWSPVFCFRDGSQASRELESLGAVLMDGDALEDIAALQTPIKPFIDQ